MVFASASRSASWRISATGTPVMVVCAKDEPIEQEQTISRSCAVISLSETVYSFAILPQTLTYRSAFSISPKAKFGLAHMPVVTVPKMLKISAAGEITS